MRSVLGVRDAIDTLIDREELTPPDGAGARDTVTEIRPTPSARPAFETIAFELRRIVSPRSP